MKRKPRADGHRSVKALARHLRVKHHEGSFDSFPAQTKPALEDVHKLLHASEHGS